MTSSVKIFRVVGVRADGTRNLMAIKLPLHDATFVRDTIVEAKIFADVLIEEENKGDRSEKPDR
jgi:hypothetical protein